MSVENKNDELITFLCTQAFQTEGLLKAQGIVLYSLLKVICENSPELIEQIKETITSTSELAISMNEVPAGVGVDTFEHEIKQIIIRFNLIKESSNYSSTFIKVQSKQ